MEKNMVELCLDDEEEVLQFGVEPIPQKSGYDLCLVRYCLTTSVVHFLAMKNTMANLWHPLGGIQISDLGEKCYLFHFFHEVDGSGTPWTFNNHLLVLHRLRDGEDPNIVPLVFMDF
ncbi:hypothetical protein Godav_021211 [Gossypium davidsonii]|uniref:DUF4283 domain-containing protein n=1 Tax=Gossypium davidsonii TaxID=34287 RepID=A0A7J8R5I4_GOSDV|nr:hypothetical protein [Gossypium davidsonii]